MSDGNRRDNPTLRRLGLAFGVVFTIGLAAWVWALGTGPEGLREKAYPIPEPQCQKTKDCDQRALQIEAREAVTSDVAMKIALGQLVLSVLGVGGVAYTVYYARLAWLATQDTLKHTQETDAKDLRPWVSIDVDVASILVQNFNSATFTYTITMRNLGKTVARNFHFLDDVVYRGQDWPAFVDRHRDARQPDPAKRGALLPGDFTDAPGAIARANEIIPWERQSDGDDYLVPVISVTAFYRADGEEEWRRTDRLFFLTVEGKPFTFGILKSELPLYQKDIAVMKTGTNAT